MRFGNTAGNDLNRCDGSVRADFIDRTEDFSRSVLRTRGRGRNFNIGPEIDVQLGLNAGLSGTIPGTPVGAELGGNIGLGFTIPPLFQSASSNSRIQQEISAGIESNQISVAR